MYPPQNQIQAQQNNAKIDFTRYIRLRYHNPGSIDVASNANAARDDFLKKLKDVRAPDLGNMQKILETCDSMKQDYNYYMSLNVKLDDILKKKATPPTISTNTAMQQNNAYPSGNNFPSNYTQKGYNEVDVQKFIAKFKCAREMALGYLGAFQNYSEAEKQFVLDTGWRG